MGQEIHKTKTHYQSKDDAARHPRPYGRAAPCRSDRLLCTYTAIKILSTPTFELQHARTGHQIPFSVTRPHETETRNKTETSRDYLYSDVCEERTHPNPTTTRTTQRQQPPQDNPRSQTDPIFLPHDRSGSAVLRAGRENSKADNTGTHNTPGETTFVGQAAPRHPQN